MEVDGNMSGCMETYWKLDRASAGYGMAVWRLPLSFHFAPICRKLPLAFEAVASMEWKCMEVSIFFQSTFYNFQFTQSSTNSLIQDPGHIDKKDRPSLRVEIILRQEVVRMVLMFSSRFCFHLLGIVCRASFGIQL